MFQRKLVEAYGYGESGRLERDKSRAAEGFAVVAAAAIIMLAVAATVAGCGLNIDGNGSRSGVPPHARIRVISGDNQTAPLGATFTQPIVVGVMDDGGFSIPGVTVAFSFYGRGVPLRFATTDSQGVAYGTLGPIARGPQTVTVSIWSGFVTCDPVTFTVYGQ